MTEDAIAKKPKGARRRARAIAQERPASTPLQRVVAPDASSAERSRASGPVSMLPKSLARRARYSSTERTAAVGLAPGHPLRVSGPARSREAEVLGPYVEEYLQSSTADPEAEYLLQAGAFRTAEDADRRRAAILLLDLDARTLRVTRQGESWHRVLVGPFSDLRRARRPGAPARGRDRFDRSKTRRRRSAMGGPSERPALEVRGAAPIFRPAHSDRAATSADGHARHDHPLGAHARPRGAAVGGDGQSCGDTT